MIPICGFRIYPSKVNTYQYDSKFLFLNIFIQFMTELNNKMYIISQKNKYGQVSLFLDSPVIFVFTLVLKVSKF